MTAVSIRFRSLGGDFNRDLPGERPFFIKDPATVTITANPLFIIVLLIVD
jgi:hypothetical protein